MFPELNSEIHVGKHTVIIHAFLKNNVNDSYFLFAQKYFFHTLPYSLHFYSLQFLLVPLHIQDYSVVLTQFYSTVQW